MVTSSVAMVPFVEAAVLVVVGMLVAFAVCVLPSMETSVPFIMASTVFMDGMFVWFLFFVRNQDPFILK